MEIKIKVKSNGIEKIYKRDGYDLTMGTIDDLVEIIDLDKIDNETEVLKMIIAGYKQIKPLILDMFPEMTEEEYRSVTTTGLVQTIIATAKAVGESFGFLNLGNLTRG